MARSLSTSAAAVAQKAVDGNEIALSTVNYESHRKGQQLLTDKKKPLASSLPEKNHCNRESSFRSNSFSIPSPSSLPPVPAQHVLFSHCTVKISRLSVKGHLE